MTFRSTIKIFILIILFSCQETKRSDKEFEAQANNDIQLLDTTTLQFLQSWDYGQRGDAQFWTKLSGDSSFYHCTFLSSPDTPKLDIYGIDNFLKDFKSDLKVDTNYYKIQFIKTADTLLSLVSTNNYAQESLLTSNVSFRKTFPEQDPFEVLSKLTQLKDDLNVIGISHYNKLGGFIQFYFPSGQHILTYLPDTLLSSTSFNKFWKADFLKGKKLKSNWNFRKLDGKINGG